MLEGRRAAGADRSESDHSLAFAGPGLCNTRWKGTAATSVKQDRYNNNGRMQTRNLICSQLL